MKFVNRAYKYRFYPTKEQVDFILSGPNCLMAIEVKNGSVIHPQDFKGLEIFTEEYPDAKPILLYRGKHKYVEKNILCYPIDDFLLLVDPNNNFWENIS